MPLSDHLLQVWLLVTSVEDSRAARARTEGRLAKVEAGFQSLAAMMGGIQASLDRQEASRDAELLPRSRKRHQSPPWAPRARSASCSSSLSSGSSSSSRVGSKPPRSKHDKTPFDQRNYLDKSVKIDTLDALYLINFRTIRILLEQGEGLEEILGVLDHFEHLCEKALTRVYRPAALISYDKSVRARANEHGPQSFASVKNVDVLRFFSYDNTIVANTKKGSEGRKNPSATPGKGSCFAFNRPEGCKHTSCRYAHTCMFCRSTSHGSSSCSTAPKAK